MAYTIKMWSMADLERRIGKWVKGSDAPSGLRSFKVAKLKPDVCRIGLDIEKASDRSAVVRAFASFLGTVWQPRLPEFDVDVTTFVRTIAYEERRRRAFFEPCFVPEIPDSDANEASSMTRSGVEEVVISDPESHTRLREAA